MKNKQLLSIAICLLVVPLAISCTDNTSSNSEEEILEDIREDTERQIEESNRQFEEQEREREFEEQERIADCQRRRTAFTTSPAEREQIEQECEDSLGFL